jgi:hypothetical protein
MLRALKTVVGVFAVTAWSLFASFLLDVYVPKDMPQTVALAVVGGAIFCAVALLIMEIQETLSLRQNGGVEEDANGDMEEDNDDRRPDKASDDRRRRAVQRVYADLGSSP